MNDYTRVPRKLKKKWQARETLFLILGYGILLAVFGYAVAEIAHRYKDSFDWP